MKDRKVPRPVSVMASTAEIMNKFKAKDINISEEVERFVLRLAKRHKIK